MTDYRLVMSLLIQNMSYRQIESLAACSHTTIARAKKICRDHNLTTTAQIKELGAEDIDALFTDGRKTPSAEFVAFDVAATVKKRTGSHKPPLRVLWADYLDTDAGPGQRHYSYQRFCQIIADYVDVNDLTMRITHIPGHTMQVDWAGTKMAVFDPLTGRKTKVSVFVATLPYSGMVFARGYLDEKSPNWLDAHQQAFEYFGGITQVIIPDNASTASTQITRGEKARDVNASYRDFLEYHRTAAVPTRVVKPQDKGNVEAGVKIVTSWVINRLADRRFADLDELNALVTDRVTAINTRTPFRGQHTSRQELFDENERAELIELPASRWEPVTWRKSKVNRDYHIEIATVKYSAPHTFAGRTVDVKITGDRLTILCDREVIATHTVTGRKHVFVTDPDHVPAQHQQSADLWSRAYFLRQAHKIGPATVTVITSVLDAHPIEAQGYRTCQNILALATGDKKPLLDSACRQLVDEKGPRAVSYTAVKQRLAAVRAQHYARPTTTTAGSASSAPGAVDAAPTSRDTRGAHLAGPESFSLDALLGRNNTGTQKGQA